MGVTVQWTVDTDQLVTRSFPGVFRRDTPYGV